MLMLLRALFLLAWALCLVACTSLFDRKLALRDAAPQVQKILAPLAPYLNEKIELTYAQSIEITSLVKSARVSLNDFFLREQNACYDNFFVNACLSPSQQEQRYWSLRIRQLEIQASSIKRQESITQNRQTIGQRLAEKPLPENATGLGDISPDQKMLEQAQKNRAAQRQKELDNENLFNQKQQKARANNPSTP